MVLIDKAETVGRNTVFIQVALRGSGVRRVKLSGALLHVYPDSPYSSWGERETNRSLCSGNSLERWTGSQDDWGVSHLQKGDTRSHETYRLISAFHVASNPLSPLTLKAIRVRFKNKKSEFQKPQDCPSPAE